MINNALFLYIIYNLIFRVKINLVLVDVLVVKKMIRFIICYILFNMFINVFSFLKHYKIYPFELF